MDGSKDREGNSGYEHEINTKYVIIYTHTSQFVMLKYKQSFKNINAL